MWSWLDPPPSPCQVGFAFWTWKISITNHHEDRQTRFRFKYLFCFRAALFDDFKGQSNGALVFLSSCLVLCLQNICLIRLQLFRLSMDWQCVCASLFHSSVFVCCSGLGGDLCWWSCRQSHGLELLPWTETWWSSLVWVWLRCTNNIAQFLLQDETVFFLTEFSLPVRNCERLSRCSSICVMVFLCSGVIAVIFLNEYVFFF